MLENLELSLSILLTGIVIVFSVLILLIGVIKLYASIVVSVQKIIDEKKEDRIAENENKKTEAAVKPEVVEKVEAEPEQAEDDDDTIPGEIVAAIAAAVEMIFGEGTVTVKSIKKSSKRRSVWKSAGVAENTRAF